MKNDKVIEEMKSHILMLYNMRDFIGVRLNKPLPVNIRTKLSMMWNLYQELIEQNVAAIDLVRNMMDEMDE